MLKLTRLGGVLGVTGLLLVAGCSGSGAGAGAAADAEQAEPLKEGQIYCAVMTSGVVDIMKATETKMYADHEGNRYYFCCAGCPDEFKADPAKFAQNAHLPIPKE
ncbi:MAG: YHS domain-containing protein [Armatimonadota bacterium]